MGFFSQSVLAFTAILLITAPLLVELVPKVEYDCSDLYVTHRVESIYVMKIKRHCFTLVSGKLYVLVTDSFNRVTSSAFHLLTSALRDFMQSYDYPVFRLNLYLESELMGDRFIVNLSEIDPNTRIEFYHGFHFISVSVQEILERSLDRTVYYGYELEEFIIERIIEPTIGLRDLEEKIDEVMRERGISGYDVVFRVIHEQGYPRVMVELILDAERLAIDELVKVGLDIKRLSEFVVIVVINEQPFLPRERYALLGELVRLKQEKGVDIDEVLKSTELCITGIGLGFPEAVFINILYDCVVEKHVKNPGEIRNFVEKVVKTLRSLPIYGYLFEKYPWIVILELPTSMSVTLEDRGIESTFSRSPSVVEPFQDTGAILVLVSAISMVAMLIAIGLKKRVLRR